MQDNRTALVIGGTQGIGLAVVKTLNADGRTVAFAGTTDTSVGAARAEVSAMTPQPVGYVLDVRDRSRILEVIEAVASEHGWISTLVYCAGISPKIDGVRRAVEDIPLDEWDDVLAVNLTGALISVQAVLPAMKERRFGRIVMIGSIAARTLPRFAGASYVASKSGLAGLARSIAVEYGAFGITANTIAPGNVASTMTGGAESAQNLEAVTRIPLGRIGVPADIAGMVGFVCSDEAGFINGATIDVAGGEIMTP